MTQPTSLPSLAREFRRTLDGFERDVILTSPGRSRSYGAGVVERVGAP